MTKQKRKTLAKRMWLNPIESSDTGAMSVSGEWDEWDIAVYASIWDCSKKIELNFSVGSYRTKNQSLNKIDKMIAGLQAARDYIEEVYPEYEEASKEKQRKEKKRKKQDAAI
jgi:hypothetical protein